MIWVYCGSGWAAAGVVFAGLVLSAQKPERRPSIAGALIAGAVLGPVPLAIQLIKLAVASAAQ